MYTRSLTIVTVLVTIALTGCASSIGGVGEKTRAQATVQRPDLKSEELAQWRQYYEDQFEVYGSEVIPPADYFPVVAKQAYTLERELWQKRAEERGQKRLAAVATAAGVSALVYVAATAAAVLLVLLIF